MRLTIAALLALILINHMILTGVRAEPGWKHNRNSTNTNSVSGFGGEAYSESNSSSGGGNVNVDGSDDDTYFFSFATTFPQAHGCLGGAQAGGAGTSGGGFFGMHFINENCWTSALAEAEANIDVRARLKCHGNVFRDAIAFEETENKQRYCVDYMVGKYKAELEAARAAVEAALNAGKIEPVSQLTPIVLAGNVTQEEFDEQATEQKSQIEDLKRRTRDAEARAAQAEQALQQMQRKELSKKEALQQLQQQVQQDYVITE